MFCNIQEITFKNTDEDDTSIHITNILGEGVKIELIDAETGEVIPTEYFAFDREDLELMLRMLDDNDSYQKNKILEISDNSKI